MMSRFLVMTAVVGLTACSPSDVILGPNQPDRPPGPSLATVPEAELVFLRHGPQAPSFATTTVSFWAHTQEDREASIYYHLAPGEIDSTEFVRFRVPKRSLTARPDGSPFASTDSIRITITIADSARLIVDFQPAGLAFNPKRPAKLWFKWDHADPDRNQDGVVDATDAALTLASLVWKQETTADPWESLTTVVSPTTHQYETKVLGFTRYAVAY